MIKAVLFDYGGVMTAGGGGNELSERLAAKLGISNDKAWELLGPVWGEFVRGRLTEEDLWRSVERDFGHPIALTQRSIWNTWQDMRPIPSMVIFAKALKTRGLTVGLLSSVIPNTAHDIQRHGGYDVFDFCVLSYESGSAKPDIAAYQQALAHLNGVVPSAVAFVDDRPMCLGPARELGMQTVLFHSPAQCITAVEQLLTR